jgi:hypothetical protein
MPKNSKYKVSSHLQRCWGKELEVGLLTLIDIAYTSISGGISSQYVESGSLGCISLLEEETRVKYWKMMDNIYAKILIL